MLTAVAFGGGRGRRVEGTAGVQGGGRGTLVTVSGSKAWRDPSRWAPHRCPCQSKWRWKATAIPACNWRSRWGGKIGGGATPHADKPHPANGTILGGGRHRIPICRHHDSHDVFNEGQP